ncbi:hypothetical protein [Phaeobacter porticola]|uniref:Uncharacterized protein n=1 Tax=Phaeobacter porticola TaxID=1844006 RepID=A0A1L3I7N0_9RHOB|nr:hypothetical protein [Phaeobacter porticola]APG48178.1 hypothetical protein PhaeoP97_02801 [Phaeobacter porticola]
MPLPTFVISNSPTGQPRSIPRTTLGAAICALTLTLGAVLPGPAARAGDMKHVGEVKSVHVLGRTWHVAALEADEGARLKTPRYTAVRQNAELDAFRPPAVLSAKQAVRAFHAATGCRANISTMVRSIDGTYIAQLVCR